MAKSSKKQKPRFSISSWTPSLVVSFLEVHNFHFVSQDGDETFWVGKSIDGNDAQASFSMTRRELTPGTMRDSVMRQSGYPKEHWDAWSRLRKTQRKKALCCGTRHIV
jgi:hypothetical protein